jgi:hypothetical protein
MDTIVDILKQDHKLECKQIYSDLTAQFEAERNHIHQKLFDETVKRIEIELKVGIFCKILLPSSCFYSSMMKRKYDEALEEQITLLRKDFKGRLSQV